MRHIFPKKAVIAAFFFYLIFLPLLFLLHQFNLCMMKISKENYVSIHCVWKKNHKIGTQVYKIQISSRYLKILSIYVFFFIKYIIFDHSGTPFSDISTTFNHSKYTTFDRWTYETWIIFTEFLFCNYFYMSVWNSLFPNINLEKK